MKGSTGILCLKRWRNSGVIENLVTKRSLSAKGYEVTVIDPVKDSRWDEFVKRHPCGWICHLSGWKKVLEESFPHLKGHFLALINREGEIKAGLPIYEIRSWLTGNRLVSIPFATLSDPLVSSSEELKSLLDFAKNLSNDLKIPNIEIRTTNSYKFLEDSNFFKINYYKIHYINLNSNLNNLWNSLHRKAVRQEIKRASKSNLKIKCAETEEDLIIFYNLYLITRKRLGLPPHPFHFFKRLWNEFYKTKNLSIYLAEFQDEVIAGHIVFKFRDRVSAEFEGWNRDYHKLSPNHFLFWEEIKSAHEEKFKIYDFGRTSPKNVNLMGFKKHWGTEVADLPVFYFNNNNNYKILINEEKFLYKLTQKVCKISPPILLKYIGKFCYNHLG